MGHVTHKYAMSHHNNNVAEDHDFSTRWNRKNNYDCYNHYENISMRAKKSEKKPGKEGDFTKKFSTAQLADPLIVHLAFFSESRLYNTLLY